MKNRCKTDILLVDSQLAAVNFDMGPALKLSSIFLFMHIIYLNCNRYMVKK